MLQMLGIYENFPTIVHKTAVFATTISDKTLQQTLMRTFLEINSKTFNVQEVADPSIPQCTVIFEYGIAEANSFNYLDREETNRVLKAIQKRPFQIMDLFCSLRYYKMQNGKRRSLRFDYYMLRFAFNKNTIEVKVFHEKGPRHISPADIANFIASKINETSSRKTLKVIKPS